MVTVLLTTVAVLVVATPRASAAELAPVPAFGTNPDGLSVYEYVPDDSPGARPLVVLSHGCPQDAAAYAPDGTESLPGSTTAEYYGGGAGPNTVRATPTRWAPGTRSGSGTRRCGPR